MFVFVYGTLKQGHGNHFLLRDCYCLGTAVTRGKYRLFDGGFPVMRDPEHARDSFYNAPVKGELYHVSDTTVLRSLDRLESEGSMYHRRQITVTVNGAKVQAYAYIGDAKFWRRHMHRQLCKLDHDGNYSWSRHLTYDADYRDTGTY